MNCEKSMAKPRGPPIHLTCKHTALARCAALRPVIRTPPKAAWISPAQSHLTRRSWSKATTGNPSLRMSRSLKILDRETIFSKSSDRTSRHISVARHCAWLSMSSQKRCCLFNSRSTMLGLNTAWACNQLINAHASSNL